MPFPHYANAQLLNPPSQREFQQVLPPKWELLPFAAFFFLITQRLGKYLSAWAVAAWGCLAQAGPRGR